MLLFVNVAFILIDSSSTALALTASVSLNWTATGDNGTSGRAARYDLRYSANPLTGQDTLTWWNRAAVVNMTTKIPSPSGAKDSVRLSGLVVGIKYYALLRAADAAGNWSGYSNLATIDLTKGVTSVEFEETRGASALTVGAPYPSPTRTGAQVLFTLARSGPLEADVFDARGRRVRSLHEGTMNAGPQMLRWDGRGEGGAQSPAGIYWIRVAAADIKKSVKVVVVH
jgi:hypothetical protein